jgi:hypothetical protein
VRHPVNTYIVNLLDVNFFRFDRWSRRRVICSKCIKRVGSSSSSLACSRYPFPLLSVGCSCCRNRSGSRIILERTVRPQRGPRGGAVHTRGARVSGNCRRRAVGTIEMRGMIGRIGRSGSINRFVLCRLHFSLLVGMTCLGGDGGGTIRSSVLSTTTVRLPCGCCHMLLFSTHCCRRWSGMGRRRRRVVDDDDLLRRAVAIKLIPIWCPPSAPSLRDGGRRGCSGLRPGRHPWSCARKIASHRGDRAGR